MVEFKVKGVEMQLLVQGTNLSISDIEHWRNWGLEPVNLPYELCS